MRKWNSWGDESVSFPATPEARKYLGEVLGAATPLPDATLAQVVAQVPASRLPAHPLVDTSAEVRVRHARGQSLPDWLAMRSGRFEHFPDGVAFPETSAQVAELLRWAEAQDVIVIPYGGGTSVAGHINPLPGRKPVLTLSLAKMSQLLHLDRESQLATFGAGANGPQVEEQLRPLGYVLGHFPQSWELSTIGGWVVTRSSGQQSMRYGRIEQLFAGGRIETPRGTLDIPTFPASSAGPDLREILMGSEGRFGVVTEVKARVTPLPECEEFRVFFFPSWTVAVDAVRSIVQQKLPLSMMRLSNAQETRTHLILAGHARQVALLERYLALRGVGEGKCMMTIGFTGSKELVAFSKREMGKSVKAFGGVGTGNLLGKRWVANRFKAVYLRESLWTLGYAIDTLETAVDWARVPAAVDNIEGALRAAVPEEKALVFTHLSHLYPQGSSIYTTYAFRAGRSYEETLERWQRYKQAASEAVVRSGGTISHQHGVGRDHAPYLPAEKGKLGMEVLQTLARHFDEGGRMNPGKLLLDEETL